ncbi:uncharacterized protein LOC115757117 [Rhodamnia argentea]|uniref:Uncharacterized protein LOC115757117 n=1 Tax=Rhodamnia argentea TaxID=178133 RepID=A0A8B8R0U3_9MYRT|nr:uncharacterized protein LOC115757117 [Rhodamnia argentea]
MMKSCVNLLGLVSPKEPPSPPQRATAGASFSLEISLQFGDISLGLPLNDVSVRIIHAGGRIELYQDVIPASHVMEKYPGMCVALPEVFRKPHESILSPEEDLVPGRKYFIIPSTTAIKLMRKYQEKMKAKEAAAEETKLDMKTKVKPGEEPIEEPICSAKDFYTSKDRWSRCSTRKRGIKKQPFVPPIPRARTLRSMTWEPSLSSVQELSP